MDKVSFSYYFFLNPMFATSFSLMIVGLFTILYCMGLSKPKRELNSFLNTICVSEVGCIIVIIFTVIAFFFNIVGVSTIQESYDAKSSIAPFNDFLTYLSKAIYIISVIYIVFMSLQPHISLRRGLKREKNNFISKLNMISDNYTTLIYDCKVGYLGITNQEALSFLNTLEVLKSKINQENTKKTKTISEFNKQINDLSLLEKKINGLYEEFKEFREKEKYVYTYIDNLEFSCIKEPMNTQTKDTYMYLKELVVSDFIKAYNFIKNHKS